MLGYRQTDGEFVAPEFDIRAPFDPHVNSLFRRAQKMNLGFTLDLDLMPTHSVIAAFNTPLIKHFEQYRLGIREDHDLAEFSTPASSQVSNDETNINWSILSCKQTARTSTMPPPLHTISDGDMLTLTLEGLVSKFSNSKKESRIALVRDNASAKPRHLVLIGNHIFVLSM
jgi:hypothetical protein